MAEAEVYLHEKPLGNSVTRGFPTKNVVFRSSPWLWDAETTPEEPKVRVRLAHSAQDSGHADRNMFFLHL